MGTTRDDGSQQSMWLATGDLPRSAGHPFYERLNHILGEAGFDAFVEDLCAKFYAVMGRPSLAPGRYFRLLLVGYFEGLDSERAIAWRAADSLSVRSFLHLSAPAAPPDHSTISRTRRLFSLETHAAVFTWVLEQLADAGLVRGKTLGIDATTLEANAAMRAIVRRDTGEDYGTFLTRLAKASGIETPTAEELARFDRKRKKKMSNEEWTHPHDPDSKIAKMKDGSTHMAHKVEHAVDLEMGAVVGLTLQGAEKGDTETVVETAVTAAEQVEAVLPEGSGVAELVGDKGYHSNETLVGLAAVGVRSYISEPDRGRRSWEDHPEARDPVYGNRRRIAGLERHLHRRRGDRAPRVARGSRGGARTATAAAARRADWETDLAPVQRPERSRRRPRPAAPPQTARDPRRRPGIAATDRRPEVDTSRVIRPRTLAATLPRPPRRSVPDAPNRQRARRRRPRVRHCRSPGGHATKLPRSGDRGPGRRGEVRLAAVTFSRSGSRAADAA